MYGRKNKGHICTSHCNSNLATIRNNNNYLMAKHATSNALSYPGVADNGRNWIHGQETH